MRTLYYLAAAVAAASALTPANTASIGGGGCSTDLSFTGGSSLLNCYGRLDGNVLNNQTSSNTAINAALDALGYIGPDITFSAIPLSNILSGLGGATTIDFPGVLNGTSYIGLHFGNGQGGPGNTTTFYAINAVNLDTFTLNLRASSDAVLLVGSSSTAVPEAATWAMMMAGFGLVGGLLRANRRRVTFA